MPAFELPELYMPYPARLNPNVDSTRVHTKAWAIEMGMLGPAGSKGSSFTWAEADFDAHEYALLCAYTHPDLPASELDIISDWYVWLFFFDDHFVETFKRGLDVAGGKAYLARLWAFIPLEPTDTPPTPTNPIERGMAQLWLRTVPQTTTDWRRRFIEHTKDTLETVLWELSNISHNRVANPLEYIAMRRMVGGCLWAAALLERANGVGLPDRVMAARPVRVLQESFADTVHLHNDLMSYTREVQHEGENANGVLVLERFLGVGTQQAANVACDVLSARVHQFENTVIAELPLFFEEYALPPQQRVDVLRLANGLMAWIAGTYEWHYVSSRYDLERASIRQGEQGLPQMYIGPTGLGTSAARICNTLGLRTHTKPRAAATAKTRALGSPEPCEFAGLKPAGRFQRPACYMPFDAKLNPRVDETREHTTEWASDMGMLDGSVWTPAKLESDDLPRRAAYLAPEASLSRLELISGWCTWGFFVDDYYVEVYKRRRDLLGAKAFAGRLASFVACDANTTITPTNPAERGLADLWRRTAPTLSAERRRTFAHRVQSYIQSALWEILNTLQNRTPDPIDYCEMRRVTGRGELALSLVELGAEATLPAELLRDRTMQQLTRTFCDVMPLRNDILSYDKELNCECEFVNAVVVLQRFFDCDVARAAAITGALATARVEQFEHLTAASLPVMFDDLELEPSTRARVRQYVGHLEDWMAGDLEWSKRSGRYTQRSARPARISSVQSATAGPYPVGPEPTAHGPAKLGPNLGPNLGPSLGLSGLGTSAAHIHTILRQSGGSTKLEPALQPGAPQPLQSLNEALRAIVGRADLGQ